MAVLSLALEVAKEGLKLANTKESRKYLDKATALELKLQELERRPYDEQDDVLFEKTMAEFKVWLQGSKNAISLSRSG